MSSKQDRTYTRTAADLERKYNFGRSFSEILGIANDAQTHAYNAETAIRKWSQRVEGLEGGFAQIEMRQNSITSRVEGLEGDYSSIKQTADGIATRVGAVENTCITLTDDINGISKEITVVKNTYSTMEQTATDIILAVESVNGDFNKKLEKYATIELTENKITQSVGDLEKGVITEIKQAVEDNSASIGMIVDNGNVNAGIIMEAINKDESSIKISADKLDIEGKILNIKVDATNIEGAVTAGIVRSEGEHGTTLINDGYIISWNSELGIRSTFDFNGLYIYGHSGMQHIGAVYGNPNNNAIIADGAWTFSYPPSFEGELYFLKENEYQKIRIDVGRHQDTFLRFFKNDTNIGDINVKTTGNSFQMRAQNGYNLSFWGYNTNYLEGNWSCDSGLQNTSDINYKNSISDVSEKYGILFDHLRPVIHKYNDGQSGRFHIGYIAQEVDEAITKAGLTRQDFAGLCIQNQGSENEKWALRYTEFVSLNTYEIQKLKKEFAELKARIGA